MFVGIKISLLRSYSSWYMDTCGRPHVHVHVDDEDDDAMMTVMTGSIS